MRIVKTGERECETPSGASEEKYWAFPMGRSSGRLLTHPNVQIDASDTTVAVLHGRDVSEYVRSFKAQRCLSDAAIQRIVTTLKPRKSLALIRLLARIG